MSIWWETAEELPPLQTGNWRLREYRPPCSLCGRPTKRIKKIGFMNDIVFTCPKDGNDRVGPSAWEWVGPNGFYGYGLWRKP